jgi:hypothetical protein
MKANKEYMIGKNYVRSYFSFFEKRRREGEGEIKHIYIYNRNGK